MSRVNTNSKKIASHLLHASPDLLDALNGMPTGWGAATPKKYLDKVLYQRVLEFALLPEAVTARCFVTKVACPLYLFLEANTVLLYQGVIRHRLQGRLDHIQKLRASASAIVFSQLEQLLGRNEISRIKKAGVTACTDVITVLCLVLEAVLDFGNQPISSPTPQDPSQSGHRDAMRESLEQLLCFYIHDVSSSVFPSGSSFFHTFGMRRGRAFVRSDFWEKFQLCKEELDSGSEWGKGGKLEKESLPWQLTRPQIREGALAEADAVVTPSSSLLAKAPTPEPLPTSDPNFQMAVRAFVASGADATTQAIRHMYLESLPRHDVPYDPGREFEYLNSEDDSEDGGRVPIGAPTTRVRNGEEDRAELDKRINATLEMLKRDFAKFYLELLNG
jgi:hypothetical protein